MSYWWSSKSIFKTTGKIIFYSSFAFLIPLILSIIYKESFLVQLSYGISFALTFIFGLLLYKLIKKETNFFEITISQALIIVCFVWLIFTFFASLPFFILTKFSVLDALFETMSAITTTGLSLYSTLPTIKSLILWRSFLSWIGGLGIIFLAYFGLSKAINSSSKLISAEGHQRIRPSLKKTVVNIWIIYFFITIIGIILLNIFGMGIFDSFNYAMSAVSTTGMQSNNLGLLGFSSVGINIVLIFLMVLGATSFLLHYLVFKTKNIKNYFKDKQFISMLLIIFIGFIFVFLKLSNELSIVDILLNVVSMITCGGFTTINLSSILEITPFVFVVFLMLMFIGGSTNSTTGGIKIDRFILFIKSFFWKVKKIMLPSIAYFPKKYNNKIIEDKQVESIYFFILLFISFIILGIFVLTFSGYSITESAFEVISAQSNVGLSIGVTDITMPIASKIMLIINMWVGRLEIIPVLSVIGMLINKLR